MKLIARIFGAFLFIALCGSASARDFHPLSDARGRIEKIRTREVELLLKDARGRPLQGRKARAVMKRHQFLFGCNLYLFEKLPPEENERYLKLWLGLFNYATVPFYFSRYQPAPERTQEAYLKKMVKWCQAHGVTVKGHPLVWHFPGTVPEWLPREPDEVEKILAARVRELPAIFKEEISYWDVVNEPTTVWMYDNPVARWENGLGPVSACAKALSWAREGNPEAGLLINDYNVMTGLWSFLSFAHPVRALKMFPGKTPRYPFSYYQLLSDLLSQGARFDAIGLQSHMHMGNWPLAKVWDLCERYAKLGLPLHFTEVTVLSGRHKIMWPFNPEVNQPWPSTDKGEKKQAEYVRDFYTLLFSHPAVEAITWWDLSDKEAWMGAPAGLVRKDFTPKPAYLELQKLIKEEWHTEFSGETDEAGIIRFRGFCGDYELFVDGGLQGSFKIDCARVFNRAEIQLH